MSRLILTDRDREALHRLAAEWRSEPASEDRGARTRETLIGLTGGGEHIDQHAAYLLALSLVELLSPAHLPPRAGSIVLRALESLADGEGGGEYVKIVNDLRSLPDAPALPDSPFLSLLPGIGDSGAGGARAGPRSEDAGDGERRDPALRPGKAAASESRDPAQRPGSDSESHGPAQPPGSDSESHGPALRPGNDSESHGPALRPGDAGDDEARAPEQRLAAIAERILREAAAGGPSPALHAASSSDADVAAGSPGGDASAAWRAPPPEAPDPETGEHAIPNLPGMDIETLARRTMQFAGDGARDRTPSADGTTGSVGVRDGTRPIGSTTGDRARRRTPLAESTTGDRARNRTPSVEDALGDDARYRAPAAPGLESVLFVESAGERFALRAGDVAAILGADAHAVARIDDRPPVFMHHGVSYHFVDLAPALALGDVHGAGESGQARAIVLLRAGGRRVALLCGGVDEQEELPVHALPPMVPREAFATAAVIAGDGRPILLLDTAALAQRATG